MSLSVGVTISTGTRYTIRSRTHSCARYTRSCMSMVLRHVCIKTKTMCRKCYTRARTQEICKICTRVYVHCTSKCIYTTRTRPRKRQSICAPSPVGTRLRRRTSPHTHACTHVPLQVRAHTCTCARLRVRIWTYMHTYLLAHTHTYAHALTHTYTHSTH